MDVTCSSSTGCPVLLSSECVFYEGAALPNTGIDTNDTLEEALQKIDVVINSGGSGVWGDITGTITDQTDLITYLSNNYLSISNAALEYVPLSRELTINGTTFDLSADRTWTVTSTAAGSTNDIQVNNAGVLAGGLGTMTSTRTVLPVSNSNAGAGLTLQNGADDFSEEYFHLLSSGYTGGSSSVNILDVTNVRAGSTFIMEVYFQAIQTSGTVGATGITLKLHGAFRVTALGALHIIGASFIDTNYTFNDTGDSFSGTPSLTVNIGNTNINFNYNLTTAKTLRTALWIKLRSTVI